MASKSQGRILLVYRTHCIRCIQTGNNAPGDFYFFIFGRSDVPFPPKKKQNPEVRSCWTHVASRQASRATSAEAQRVSTPRRAPSKPAACLTAGMLWCYGGRNHSKSSDQRTENKLWTTDRRWHPACPRLLLWIVYSEGSAKLHQTRESARAARRKLLTCWIALTYTEHTYPLNKKQAACKSE